MTFPIIIGLIILAGVVAIVLAFAQHWKEKP